MEQRRTQLCYNSRGETRGWKPSSSYTSFIQREIHHQRPSCIRLHCREAWKLRNCPINKRCDPLCQEREQLPDNREYTFGEWLPEDIEVSCGSGNVEIWKYPGTDLGSRTRIYVAKYEEGKGTLLLATILSRTTESSRYQIPNILQRGRSANVTHRRLVEYELTITNAIQSEAPLHSWPQQLLQNILSHEAVILYSSLRYADDGRFLRLFRKSQISLVLIRRIQSTQDNTIFEPLVTRFKDESQTERMSISEETEHTYDNTIELFT